MLYNVTKILIKQKSFITCGVWHFRKTLKTIFQKKIYFMKNVAYFSQFIVFGEKNINTIIMKNVTFHNLYMSEKNTIFF